MNARIHHNRRPQAPRSDVELRRNIGLIVLLLAAIVAVRSLATSRSSEVRKVPAAGSALPRAAKAPRASIDADPGVEAFLAGVLQARATTEGGKIMVPITLRFTPRCGPGDADVISFDLEHARTPELLLSLEPLDARSGIKGSSRRINLTELASGATHRLSIPDPKRPTPMGVFLCLDESHSGRCLGKDSADANAVLSRKFNRRFVDGQLTVTDDGSSYRPRDKTYVFQHLMLGGDKVSAPAASVSTAADYDRYKSFLEANGSAALGPSMKLVRGLSGALANAPATLGDGGLKLQLPKGDPALCRGKSK